mgnify:CR=1 FL=1
MNKAWLNIALILLILLNGMGYTLIHAHFYLDREQITALYCVNKDKPMLECDGKCELGKRLSETKNRQESGEEITLEELSLVYALERSEPIQLPPLGLIHPEYLIHYSNFRISELNWDFFHPPQS